MKVRIEFEFEQAESQVHSFFDKANALIENIKTIATTGTAEAKPASRRRASSSEVAAPAAPAAPASTTVTLQELRTLLSSKVAEHKAEIKVQLTQLGAKNLTTLAPEKYEELYEYLKALS